MVAIKLLILVVILTCLVYPEVVEANAKNQLGNVKRKKTIQAGKLKTNLKPVSKTNQRNGKMNYYNSHLWPSTTTYYRPSTSSIYLRAPSTTSPSFYYPTHWGNSYISPSSFMTSNTLRRTDDFSASSPISTSLNAPILSMGNSQVPTLYDMSAFTGNAGLLEHPLTNSNPNLWSISETVAPTPKPKTNLFNSFNYNNDDGLFAGFLNQLLK